MTLMLAPLVPHFAEEVWSRMHGGHSGSIVRETFPTADPALLVEDQVELPVQVQGKVRSRILVPAGADEAAVRAAALSDEKVRAFLEGKTVQKTIVVTDQGQPVAKLNELANAPREAAAPSPRRHPRRQ